MNISAVLIAIGSAVLFGLSAPVAKILLDTSDPWMLAGILYGGAGVGLLAVHLAIRGSGALAEARLTRRELPWLAAAVLSGGVVGPVLLLVGLVRVNASAASLLLTLEGVLTALLAWFVFKENFDRRIALGMLSIVAGAVVLNWRSDATVGDLIGPAAIVGACLAWALDNNLTRKVSLSDPVQIAMIKGLVAGPVSIAIGYAAGSALPPPATVGLGAVTGFLGYGVSLVLFVLALRHLGTARTGAYFSIAPFIGAVVSIPLFGEAVTLRLFSAGALMAFGVWLHLSERHEHDHAHPEGAHEHRHSHDEHQDHVHDESVDPTQPHSHWHRHKPLRHAHPHTPDSHHQHSH
jgi:drug/metabolite transporter (DMT)-like permease